MSFIIFVIWAYLSTLLFSFLFYKLNHIKPQLFQKVQIKINNLSEKKKRRLGIIANILFLIIIFILPIFNDSDIIAGLIIGFLFSFKDICFNNNVIEYALKDYNEIK